MTSDIARMIRLARDQARLTTLDYATRSSMILLSYMVTETSAMTVLWSVVSAF